MTPLWLFTLGQRLLDSDAGIALPFGRVSLSLLIVFIPLVVGVLISRYKPRLARGIRKVLRTLFVIQVVAMTALFMYVYWFLFKMLTVVIVVAGCCLPYIGFLVGGALSAVCCQSWNTIVTIGIETGIQNIGIAFIILTNSLPHPEMEMSMVGPTVACIVMPVPLCIAVDVQEVRRRLAPEVVLDEKDNDQKDDTEARSSPPQTDITETKHTFTSGSVAS